MADDGKVANAKTYFWSEDEGDDKLSRARRAVVEYHKNHVRVLREEPFERLDFEDTYVVLFSYILGNWKAHVSTTRTDGRYYEVTYNSAKDELYVDEYKKQNNVCYKGEGSGE